MGKVDYMLILKCGGQRAYLTWKRFFIGLVIGEALAVVVWTIVHAATGNQGGYSMEYN